MTLARTLLLAALLTLVAAAPASAIVGGQVTTRAWPHMTALEFRSGSGFSFACGGSLVRPDVVLTAAHCVSGDSDGDPDTTAPANIRVQLPPTAPDGTRRRSAGGERIAVTEVVEHPDFDASPQGGSDIALLKLAQPATAGRPIRLAGPGDAAVTAPGTEAPVIGFGAQVPFGPGSDELREASVPLVSDDECERTSTSRLDRPTQLCAGNLEGAEDSCQGDSGGPLMVQDASRAWILVGVVSQGVGCGTPTQFGIYAEVMSEPLRSFVESNASRMSTAAAPTAGGPAAPAPAPGTAPAPASGGRTRLTLPSSLGSVRSARARRRFVALLRTSGAVRSISTRLVQRGRTLAVGRRSSLRARRGRVSLRLRRSPRAGTAILRVTARDAGGRLIRVSRRVRLRA